MAGVAVTVSGGTLSRQSLSVLDLPGELRNRIYEHAIATNKSWPPTLYHNPHSTVAFSARHSNLPFLGLAQANEQLRKEFKPLHARLVKPFTHFWTLGEYLETFPLPDAALSDRIASIRKGLSDIKVVTQAAGVDILPALQADWGNMPFQLVKDCSDGDRNPSDMTHWLISRMRFAASDEYADYVQGNSFLWDGMLSSMTVVRRGIGKFRHGNEGNLKNVQIMFNDATFVNKDADWVEKIKKEILGQFAKMLGACILRLNSAVKSASMSFLPLVDASLNKKWSSLPSLLVRAQSVGRLAR
ncbi:hypothetical protein CC86DRAFT_425196 [Ophiobolus disseminans]|uniref:F-box domain-containing protein n=1 Tax=Ophiobolus disseminans TaxID=1469910 RepID=A0A6A7AIX8_9PLEO|nr:hypothetical protein CC86DRAFT_425196 [Ophiobolus disseminans]